jgi:hypothetical protein
VYCVFIYLFFSLQRMIVARNLVRRRFLSAAASAAPSESGRDVTNAANAAQPNANNEQNNKSNAPLTNYEIREKMDEVFRRPVVRRKKKKKKKKKKNFFIDFFFFLKKKAFYALVSSFGRGERTGGVHLLLFGLSCRRRKRNLTKYQKNCFEIYSHRRAPVVSSTPPFATWAQRIRPLSIAH